MKLSVLFLATSMENGREAEILSAVSQCSSPLAGGDHRQPLPAGTSLDKLRSQAQEGQQLAQTNILSGRETGFESGPGASRQRAHAWPESAPGSCRARGEAVGRAPSLL